MQLSPLEQRVVDAVAARREALVALTRELVAFDTVTHTAGDPPRQERALQEHLAALLRSHGAEVELHEPDAAALRPHPMVPEELTFEGRPQLVARFRGSGGGARCCSTATSTSSTSSRARTGRWQTRSPPRCARACSTAAGRAT